MIRGSTILALAAAVAFASASAFASIKLTSGGATLCLSENGAVESLTVDGGGRVMPATEAFTLQLRDAKGEPTRLNSSEFAFVPHAKSAKCAKLSEKKLSELGELGVRQNAQFEWRHANGLVVRMAITATGGEFRFKPSVEIIPAGMLLEWFDGPQIHVAADNTLFWPYVDGVEVTDVTRRGNTYQPISFRDRNWRGIYSLYPSYCQMQFLAAYKNGRGVYFSAVDDRHTLKQVDWERIGDKAVRLSLMTFCGDLDADGAWRSTFHYALRPYDGGWMDACEIYRDWVRTLPAFANPPKRPKWMYDSPVNLIYPVRGEGLDNKPRNMPPNCYFPYMKAMAAVEKYGKLLDSRIMALLMHWEGTAPWAPPYVWPPYGGEAELAKFRDALHARGDLLGVYCSGTAWTQVSCIVLVSLVRRFNALRKKHPSFLLEGKMVKPPFMCASHRTKLCVSNKTNVCSPDVPEVFVSFWENAEGKRIGFATNWRREPSDLKITHADDLEETRRLAPLETIELH